MTDQEVYDLLLSIDIGHITTEDEIELLKSIKRIKWYYIDKLPNCINILSALTYLDLSEINLDDISMLAGLRTLEYLNLGFTKVSDINALKELTELKELNLGGTNVSDISALNGIKGLKSLDLSVTNVNDISSLSGLRELSILNLGHSGVSDISALNRLTKLKELYLSSTKVRDISAISALKALRNIDLSYTNVRDITALSVLTALSKIDLSFTAVSDITALSGLAELKELGLSFTRINDISALKQLTRLKKLDISYTIVRDISALNGLFELEVLKLNRTNVSDISALGNLMELDSLDLRYLKLKNIPESILKNGLPFLPKYMPRERGIQIEGLILKDQPIEIFKQSRNAILEYYKSQEQTVPINACKVVFLGDGGAGKSLIIDRLMRDGTFSYEFTGESTPGVCIKSKKYIIGDEKIDLHFWDFGGQAIMHSMHRLFFTNHTLYVVVVNARDNKANEQAWYWIRNIKSFVNNAPVFLIVNQKDQNPSANVNENGLRKEYTELKDIRVVSALKDSKEVFNREIRDVICQIVSSMETVHTPIPRAWVSLMNDILEMNEDYITSDEFYNKCSQNHLGNKSEVFDQIIRWYQNLGVCFYSRKHPVSQRYMVLKPRWLLNAIYILCFNGRRCANNGILREVDLYNLLLEPLPNNGIRKVYSDIVYNAEEIQYILNVLISFNLIYRIDIEQLFVPMLCDENEPNFVDEFESEVTTHVSFIYDYLPENVIHRLMVLRGFELNMRVVWKNGALFENRRCGWQALVYGRDNCLNVYAKASDQKTHPINTYLDLIREGVYRINTDYGLEAREFITYFKDGREEDFDYLRLEEMRKAGLEKVYSLVFHSQLNIDDIIGATKSPHLLTSGNEDERHLQSLLISLTKNLLKLQNNRTYYNKTENECNSYVRDLLELNGYVCKDQALQRTVWMQKSSGELDLLIIDKDRENDIAIYEALKLDQKTFAKAEQDYLSAHLLKLLDNYNPSGFANLFLVSYVTWDKELFDDLTAKYLKYVSNNVAAPYEIMESSMLDYLNTRFLICCRVRYSCGGISTYVYHFVVRVAA